MKNKNVIVTGGNAGIGKAIAIHFVKQGANVIIFGRNEEKTKKALFEIKQNLVDDSQQVSYVIVDVSKFDAVEKATGSVVSEYPSSMPLCSV